MKAILEIELPEKCSKCVLSGQDYIEDGFTQMYCTVLLGKDIDCPRTGRRHDCPLKLADTTQEGDRK